MRDKPSSTAAWVAACRTLGRALPPDAQLADDPFGSLFAGSRGALFAKHVPRVAALPLRPFVLYMQVRTRAIDDVLHRFVAAGGRQILILGAGYDCRASRFVAELGNARVFEIDHPATQARKREVLVHAKARSAAVDYLAWDFEGRPVSELPASLAELGHDAALPTLTIWEGVTMYLTEGAIDGTVKAVRALSAPGSPFVVTYFDRAAIDRPSPARKVVSRIVASAGEPFRFGWLPSEAPAWFAARGFDVEWDKSMALLARELLPVAHQRMIRREESRIVLLRKRD